MVSACGVSVFENGQFSCRAYWGSTNLGVVTAEQKALLDEIVWVDPERMSGPPCFKGTRVPVQALFDHIEGDATLEEFLEGFPSVAARWPCVSSRWQEITSWRKLSPREGSGGVASSFCV